uniref:Uncharacterized protein n=1 Tax=Marmota marmota marmota TaxID=9994 RepID=A0A8C6EYF3_MARMA
LHFNFFNLSHKDYHKISYLIPLPGQIELWPFFTGLKLLSKTYRLLKSRFYL